jgi:hypothetical protein
MAVGPSGDSSQSPQPLQCLHVACEAAFGQYQYSKKASITKPMVVPVHMITNHMIVNSQIMLISVGPEMGE